MNYYDAFTTTSTYDWTFPAMPTDLYEAKRKRCKNPKAAQSPEDFVAGRRFMVETVNEPLHEVTRVDGDSIYYKTVKPNGFLNHHEYRDNVETLILNNSISML